MAVKNLVIHESKKTRVRDSGGCEKPNSLSRLGRWRFVTGLGFVLSAKPIVVLHSEAVDLDQF